jgi:hypothetical protein
VGVAREKQIEEAMTIDRIDKTWWNQVSRRRRVVGRLETYFIPQDQHGRPESIFFEVLHNHHQNLVLDRRVVVVESLAIWERGRIGIYAKVVSVERFEGESIR